MKKERKKGVNIAMADKLFIDIFGLKRVTKTKDK